jgi:hypothetical protein
LVLAVGGFVLNSTAGYPQFAWLTLVRFVLSSFISPVLRQQYFTFF